MDGEHYPPVVRAAIEQLPSQILGCQVVAAALMGGIEKLAAVESPELGCPVVKGSGPEGALVEGLTRFRPDLVVDLSDSAPTACC